MHPDFLRQLSFVRANPEFASQFQELSEFARYAMHMQQTGKLSKREVADIEGHLWGKFIEALPMEEYAKLRRDGTFEHLEGLTAHDGERNYSTVQEDREAVLKKLKADALDTAWLGQNIDSKKYAEMNRDNVGSSEELNHRIAHEDYDGAASEMFASRHDTSPHDGQDMDSYVADRFGEKPPRTPEADESDSHTSDDPTSDYPFSVVSRSWEE